MGPNNVSHILNKFLYWLHLMFMYSFDFIIVVFYQTSSGSVKEEFEQYFLTMSSLLVC